MRSPVITVVLTTALVAALALSVTQEGQGIKDIVAAVIAARIVGIPLVVTCFFLSFISTVLFEL